MDFQLRTVSACVAVALVILLPISFSRAEDATPSGTLPADTVRRIDAAAREVLSKTLIERSLLSKGSYRELETETRLTSGAGTQYGLGIGVEVLKQRRRLEHGGEVSGFTAQNTVYPDERAAIIVLVNQDAARATDQLGEKLEEILFDQAHAADDERTAQARAIFAGLQQGQLDRGLFTANANAYFSDEAIADFKASLAPLGVPKEFKQTRHWLRGGMSGRAYAAKFADRTLRAWTYEMPDGKLEQFQVAVQE